MAYNNEYMERKLVLSVLDGCDIILIQQGVQEVL